MKRRRFNSTRTAGGRDREDDEGGPSSKKMMSLPPPPYPLITTRRPRPYPESNVLRTMVDIGGGDRGNYEGTATTSSSTTTTCPLLQDFFKKVRAIAGKTEDDDDHNHPSIDEKDAALAATANDDDIYEQERRKGLNSGNNDDDNLQPRTRGGGGDAGATTTTTAGAIQQQQQQQQGTDSNGASLTAAAIPVLTPQSLDDSSLSTLSSKQHKRFLQLSNSLHTNSNNSISTWRESVRKEYENLVKLVQKEQHQYRLAVEAFWLGHPERLSIGFKNNLAATVSDKTEGRCSAASAFAQLALHPDHVRDHWIENFTPLRYGQCRQVFSLQPHLEDSFSKLTIADLSNSLLVGKSDDDDDNDFPPQQQQQQQFPDPNQRIPFPKVSNIMVPTWIRSDKKALELAQQHKADIVTTYDSLACVIRLTQGSSQWMMPAVTTLQRGHTIHVLDVPVPQPYTSPRDCLERGLEEGIYQWLEDNQKKMVGHGDGPDPEQSTNEKDEAGGGDTGTNVQYQYSLLTIPSSSRTVKALRIIIRSRCGTYDNNTRRPLSVHAVAEYFAAERGCRELPTSSDRALCVLDHVCHMRSVVCRVDPAVNGCCTCLGFDQPSLAQALPAEPRWYERSLLDADATSNGVIHHWKTLACLLRGVRTLCEGCHIICFPSRTMTTLAPGVNASVHAELKGGEDSCGNHAAVVANETSCCVDLISEIRDRAPAVTLGLGGFRRCIRAFDVPPSSSGERWIPYTFPVKEGN